jgi:GNAT superfamily N-acetyltransferase
MTVTFQREQLFPGFDEAQKLLQLHWEEIAPYQDLFRLDPRVEVYQALQDNDALAIVTARDDGKLVGYFIMFCQRHPHYASTKVAVEDIKFLDQKYRGGTGLKMIKFAERLARQLGCKVIFQRSKAKSEHGPMYARLGYDLIDEVYAKRLDREDAHGD